MKFRLSLKTILILVLVIFSIYPFFGMMKFYLANILSHHVIKEEQMGGAILFSDMFKEFNDKTVWEIIDNWDLREKYTSDEYSFEEDKYGIFSTVLYMNKFSKYKRNKADIETKIYTGKHGNKFESNSFIKNFDSRIRLFSLHYEKLFDSLNTDLKIVKDKDFFDNETEEAENTLNNITITKLNQFKIDSRLYSIAPVYAENSQIGFVMFSGDLDIFPISELKHYVESKDFIFSLIIAMFLILLIVHPITKLSKQTSSVLDKTGKITTTEFAYKKRRDEIGDLSRSFSTLINKLNEQMQSVEANTSDMVHEFKNPLAAIRSSMELLDFDDVSGEERKEILASVHSELKHLEILLNDIRAHSKIQNLNNESDKENVPVGILTENIVSRIQKNYPAVDFTFNCESREDSVFAKPENLDKMIGNLIENAASFAVNSEKKQVLVRVKCMKDINRVKTIMHISVEDSGPGVPESETEKIFGRYYSHREDSQRKSHSGLGLSMVKAVADSLNGSITVLRSGKLGGAKFVVSIPLFEDVEVIEEKHGFLFSRIFGKRY